MIICLNLPFPDLTCIWNPRSAKRWTWYYSWILFLLLLETLELPPFSGTIFFPLFCKFECWSMFASSYAYFLEVRSKASSGSMFGNLNYYASRSYFALKEGTVGSVLFNEMKRVRPQTMSTANIETSLPLQLDKSQFEKFYTIMGTPDAVLGKGVASTSPQK